MEFIKNNFKDLVVIKPTIFKDQRGYFFESYNRITFLNGGIEATFVQDNQSLSQKGVLRGLHFQAPPFEQGKLVRVLHGSVLDVVVDIRKESATYGQHFSIKLDANEKTMLYIPPGFAHGFLTLEDNTVFSYKCTNVYNKASEGAILWNDSDLNINWGINNPIISEKDQQALPLKSFISPF